MMQSGGDTLAQPLTGAASPLWREAASIGAAADADASTEVVAAAPAPGPSAAPVKGPPVRALAARSCCGQLRGWALQRVGSIAAVAVLLALELLVLLWALRWPEPVCADPDAPPINCFPSWRSYFVVATVLGALGGMGIGTPPDLTMLVATLLLVTTDTLSRADAYRGFSDPGPITVGAMFVIARALNDVGAVGLLASALLGSTRHLRVATLSVCLPTAVLSAFINNTPIVATLVPLVKDWYVISYYNRQPLCHCINRRSDSIKTRQDKTRQDDLILPRQARECNARHEILNQSMQFCWVMWKTGPSRWAHHRPRF
jgi:hypothetical protein